MNDDAILSSLGVPLATPFNWGNEPQCSASAVEPNSLSATPSGLDSLVHFVKEDGGSSDVNVGGASDDAELKNVLKSLLANAKVPLTTASLPPESTANSKRYEELMKTNDIFSRDVSIRGRSDRACAELTVASKSSLFGSILRIFDMTESDLKMAADTKKVAPSGSPPSGVAPFLPFSSPAAVEEVNDSMIAKAPILSTAEIVRSCHLTASPGDSKFFMLFALLLFHVNLFRLVVALICSDVNSKRNSTARNGFKRVYNGSTSLSIIVCPSDIGNHSSH